MDREKMATVRCLSPRIVAKIAFNERTQAGHLRHSKFLRLRDREDVRTKSADKPEIKLRLSKIALVFVRLASFADHASCDRLPNFSFEDFAGSRLGAFSLLCDSSVPLGK